MKIHWVVALGLMSWLSSSPVRAEENFPIVSANGFACSQVEGMVSCRGSFPGTASPVLEATGYNVIWIRGEFPGQRFTYYSDSGCLCRAEFKEGGNLKMQECTSQFGKTKKFKEGKSNFQWCQKSR